MSDNRQPGKSRRRGIFITVAVLVLIALGLYAGIILVQVL